MTKKEMVFGFSLAVSVFILVEETQAQEARQISMSSPKRSSVSGESVVARLNQALSAARNADDSAAIRKAIDDIQHRISTTSAAQPELDDVVAIEKDLKTLET